VKGVTPPPAKGEVGRGFCFKGSFFWLQVVPGARIQADTVRKMHRNIESLHHGSRLSLEPAKD